MCGGKGMGGRWRGTDERSPSKTRAGVLFQLLLQKEASVRKGIVRKSYVLTQDLCGLFAKVCSRFRHGQPKRFSSLAAGLAHDFDKISMVLGQVLVLPTLFVTRERESPRRENQKIKVDKKGCV